MAGTNRASVHIAPFSNEEQASTSGFSAVCRLFKQEKTFFRSLPP
jgi:hypothetical protein